MDQTKINNCGLGRTTHHATAIIRMMFMTCSEHGVHIMVPVWDINLVPQEILYLLNALH